MEEDTLRYKTPVAVASPALGILVVAVAVVVHTLVEGSQGKNLHEHVDNSL